MKKSAQISRSQVTIDELQELHIATGELADTLYMLSLVNVSDYEDSLQSACGICARVAQTIDATLDQFVLRLAAARAEGEPQGD